MATDFTTMQNSAGGPADLALAQHRPASNPMAHVKGGITNEHAASVYQDMIAIAQRDLQGTALEARLQAIEAMRANAPERFWAGSDVTLGGPDPATGFPKSLQPSQVELWGKASASPYPATKENVEALQAVRAWVTANAAPAKAAELVQLAERNQLVLRALSAHARAANQYRGGRPQ
jgi:hypothetical protein